MKKTFTRVALLSGLALIGLTAFMTGLSFGASASSNQASPQTVSASVQYTPVVGDWDGNGTVTIGVYDPGSQTFYLRNSNTIGFADLTIKYGPSGAAPLAGDWDGL